MPPPPIAEALINQFITFLEPNNIAIRSASSSAQAQAIVDVVKKRVVAQRKPAVSDQERLKQYIDNIYIVLHSANIADIAVDHDVPEATVRRILSVIEVAVVIFLGPHDSNRGRSPNIWSILDPRRPLNAMHNQIVWPQQLPAHVNTVCMAIEQMMKNGKPLGPKLMAVSTQDIGAVLYGARLLGLALGRSSQPTRASTDNPQDRGDSVPLQGKQLFQVANQRVVEPEIGLHEKWQAERLGQSSLHGNSMQKYAEASSAPYGNGTPRSRVPDPHPSQLSAPAPRSTKEGIKIAKKMAISRLVDKESRSEYIASSSEPGIARSRGASGLGSWKIVERKARDYDMAIDVEAMDDMGNESVFEDEGVEEQGRAF
jgi:hypothetical protein